MQGVKLRFIGVVLLHASIILCSLSLRARGFLRLLFKGRFREPLNDTPGEGTRPTLL
jgi:hypothetical protein